MPATLPPPPTSRKALSTYRALIEATRASVRSSGIVSPEAIADRAGVSPATFYTYFASKDAALAAAFDASLAGMLHEVTNTLGIEALLVDGLAAVVTRLAERVVAGFSNDARTFRLAIGRLPDSELVATVYRQRQRETVAELGRFIRLGAAAGKIRDDAPEAVAAALLVSIQGYQNPIVMSPESEPIVAELAGMLVGLLEPRHPPR